MYTKYVQMIAVRVVSSTPVRPNKWTLHPDPAEMFIMFHMEHLLQDTLQGVQNYLDQTYPVALRGLINVLLPTCTIQKRKNHHSQKAFSHPHHGIASKSKEWTLIFEMCSEDVERIGETWEAGEVQGRWRAGEKW